MLETLTCLLPLLGDPSATADPAVLVLRSYDITGTMGWHAPLRVGERVFPVSLPPANAMSTGNVIEAHDWGPDPDRIANVLQDIFSAEFESSGRRLWIDEQRRLFVRATEATQRGVQEVLAALESACAQPVEIAVDIVRQPAGAASIASALVAAADADRILTAAGGTRESHVLRVPVGNVGWIDATTAHDVLVDYDVEVAQGATQYDPIVETIETGLRLEARAAPAPSGIWLALVLRDLTPIGAPRELEIDTAAMIRSERGLLPYAAPGALQSLPVASRALALNAAIPEGKALLVQTQLGTRDAQGSTLVCLRSTGKPTPRQLELGAPSNERRKTLVHVGAVVPPRAELRSTSEHELGARPLRWRRPLDEEQALFAVLEQPGIDGATEFFPENLARDVFGPWAILQLDPTMGQGEYATEDLATVLARLAPSPRMFQLRLSLEKKGAPPIARAVLAVRLAEPSAVVLGSEASYVVDDDAEVAQDASLLDPIVGVVFEGFVVRAVPRAGVQGDLSLDITVVARARREPSRRFETRSPSVGSVAEETLDELLARERLSFPKDGSAARPITLGDAAGGGLSLSVEMTEVR